MKKSIKGKRCYASMQEDVDEPKPHKMSSPFAFLFSLIKKETKKSRPHKTRLKFGDMAENKQAQTVYLLSALGGLTG